MGTLLGRLRGVSPFGPIFGKELRSTARRKRTYVLRFVYLGALLLLLTAVYSGNHSQGANPAYRAQRFAEMGEVFFAVFGFFTLSAMALVGPILTSTAINSERLHKTLGVLLMTPITAWQIVAGKLFARLLVALTLIGLSLPVLAVVRLLGSVEIESMFAVICLCTSTVLMTAAVGLFFSTLMNRAYAVILLSYGFLLFVWMAVPLLIGLYCAAARVSSGATMMALFQLASAGHAYMAMAMIVVPDKPMGGYVGWWWCTGIQVALAAVLVFVSGVILRRMAKKEADGSGVSNPGWTPPPPAWAAVPPPLPQMPAPVEPIATGNETKVVPPPLPDALPPVGAPAALNPPVMIGHGTAPAKQKREVGDNPVLWRETRQPLVRRPWQRIVGSVLIVGLLLVVYLLMGNARDHRSGSALQSPEGQAVFACIFCGLLNLLACVIPATAIAHEKETDTWTLLLATPLSAWQIVWGKLAGLGRRLLWPSALVVAHFLLFWVFGVINFATLLLILWMTFTTNMIWLATGLLLSLWLRTVTFAVILNLLGPVLIYAVAAVVALILGSAIANEDNWGEVVGVYAPYAYMVQGTTELNRIDEEPPAVQNARRTYGPTRPPRNKDIWVPVFGRVPRDEFFELVLVVGLTHLAAAGGVVWFTVTRFDRIVGRARGKEERSACVAAVLSPGGA